MKIAMRLLVLTALAASSFAHGNLLSGPGTNPGMPPVLSGPGTNPGMPPRVSVLSGPGTNPGMPPVSVLSGPGTNPGMPPRVVG